MNWFIALSLPSVLSSAPSHHLPVLHSFSASASLLLFISFSPVSYFPCSFPPFLFVALLSLFLPILSLYWSAKRFLSFRVLTSSPRFRVREIKGSPLLSQLIGLSPEGPSWALSNDWTVEPGSLEYFFTSFLILSSFTTVFSLCPLLLFSHSLLWLLQC